jgi:hypothetical protein
MTVSLARLRSWSLRGLLFVLAIAGGLTALAVRADVSPTAQTIAACAAVVATLLLLLPCVQSVSSRFGGLIAILLVTFGTRLLDGLSGGWAARSLVVFAWGGVATVIWWEDRGRPRPWRAAVSAALAGAAAAVSATSLALVALPVFEVAYARALSVQRRVVAAIGIALLGGLALFAARAVGWGFVVGSGCAAWRGQGAWLLLIKLFSSQEGLFSASPLLWLGVIGWLIGRASERRLALAVGVCWILAGLLLWEFPMTGGGFEGLVPLLVIGLGSALDRLQRVTGRWPLLPACAAGLALVIWNLLLMAEYRDGSVPRDDTVAFVDLAAGAAREATRLAGPPLSWPGNWLAASSYGVPFQRFDSLAALDLFGSPDARQATLTLADGRLSPLLLEGWGSPRLHSGRLVRRMTERARMLVPMRCAEPLDVVIVAAGNGPQTLSINDARMSGWMLDDVFRERRARVRPALWRCPMSTITIEGAASGEAWIESLVLIRREGDVR